MYKIGAATGGAIGAAAGPPPEQSYTHAVKIGSDSRNRNTKQDFRLHASR